MTALSHPTLGRPLVKALPTGSSIPSIDFEDLLELRLPRFDDRVEEEISDLVVKAANLQMQANALETATGEIAEAVIIGAIK